MSFKEEELVFMRKSILNFPEESQNETSVLEQSSIGQYLKLKDELMKNQQFLELKDSFLHFSHQSPDQDLNVRLFFELTEFLFQHQ